MVVQRTWPCRAIYFDYSPLKGLAHLGRGGYGLDMSDEILKDKMLILPDSNFIIGIICKNDKHAQRAGATFEALRKYDHVVFLLFHVVIGETINRLTKKEKISIASAIKKIETITNKKNIYSGGRAIDLKALLERYRGFTKKPTLKKLDHNDYLIVTEAILQDAKIVTSDVAMFKSAKTILKKNIYFVGESDKVDSDHIRLIKDVDEKRKK